METEGAASEDFIARRTESLDAYGISKLVKRATEAVFGRTNAESIIEKANLAISLASTTKNELLGHMAFFDYPNLPSVDQAKWEEWLQETYNCPKTLPINTLFLHLFVAKEGFEQGASVEILRTTFMAVPMLQFVLLTVAPGTNLGPALGAHFTPVPVREEGASPTHSVYVTHRHQHFPMLHIRTARVEDADDLMPIFMQHTGDISKQYGEHFLAELIASQDDHHKTVVADVGGKTVGFLSVSTELDVDLLNTCYQLEPFHGLRHPSDADEALSEGSYPGSSATLMSSSEKSIITSEPGKPTPGLKQSSASIGVQQKSSASILAQQKSTVSIGAPQKSSVNIGAQQKSTVNIGAQQKSSVKIGAPQTSSVNIGAPQMSSVNIGAQQKSSVNIGAPQKSSVNIGTPQKSSVNIGAQQKSSVNIGAPQKSSVNIGAQQKSSVSIAAQQKSSVLTAAQQKSSVSIAAQQKSSVSLAAQQKSSVSIAAQQKSSVSIAAQQKSTASIAGAKSSTASKVKIEQQTSTRALGQQQSLAAMMDPKTTQSVMLESAVSVVSLRSEREGETSTSIPHYEEPDKSSEGSPGQKRRRRRQYMLKGGCSALAIQLFAIDERYEMRSIDLLPAVFQLFPEYDFCILTQPHSAPEFPFLSHFSRVNPRVECTVSQELFVFHKCALLHSFAVHLVQSSDLPAVERLVGGLEGGEGIVGDVRRYVEAGRDPLGEGATPLCAVVAECADQVVGVAVIRQEEDIGYIRSHYNIEDFVYFDYHRPEEHAHLHHCVLNPAFAPHTKHFIKELLRLSHKSCLYYSLHTSGLPPAHLKPHTVTSALGNMVPIRPRQQIAYHVESLGINAPLGEVLEEREPFALYHTNRKLTLEPKIPVNSRVVVVGASDTAMACLEKLVFSPHLRFNNLTLISPHGVPHNSEEDGYHCLPHSCCYWPESYSLMGLSSWVNVVRGKMVAIDRSKQCVVVESDSKEGGRVYYDQLVLCTGTQFQLPPEEEDEEEEEEEDKESSHIFAINYKPQATAMLAWVKSRLIPDGGHVVVYGSSLAAYSTTASLLSAGLPPDRLTLALPHPPCCFNNAVVEERVGGTLQELGVTMLTGVQVEGWSCEEGGGVNGVELSGTGGESITLECKALVFLHDQYRHVDQQAFKAMNDACLVFDHRLVIDTEHRTNDPLIFAAGPLTKFSRRYRADHWTHANFNSKEVGQKLASTLLCQLDPTADSTPPPTSDLLPSYTLPKIVSATLPGDLHYLHVEKPNCGERLQTLMEQPNYGRELVTDTERGYFRLHVNQYSKVQTITVLSKQPFEVTNYLCLYNIHEKYLNNLLVRYDEKLIPDFFSYFREPWTCAIFHDRFPDFMGEVREHLTTPMEGQTESFEARVQNLLNEETEVSLANHWARLATEFESSPVKEVIEKRLFRFLHYNSYHLPMYAKPDMI